jgi:hypothetical protein
MIASPKVDLRTPGQVAAEVRALLARTVSGGWPHDPTRKDPGEALIQIFAHFCGIAIDRLNRAPDKNLLAFLDLQGASLRPAQAARVPLTFHLAAQYKGHVVVHAYTQVAAAPEKGEQEPVIFETERELIVTSAVLDALFVKDPRGDTYADYSSILREPAKAGVPMFQGKSLVEHWVALDLGLPVPQPVLSELRLHFEIDAPPKPLSGTWVSWETWNGMDWIPLPPATDGTQGLTRTGDIVFQSSPPIFQSEIAGRRGDWIRCRTVAPIQSEDQLPTVRGVAVTIESARQGLAPDAAVVNGAAVDTTKEIFPFGERPRFGDTFYLASREAFSKPGAVVTIAIDLVNPESGGIQTPIPPVTGRSVRLRWEIWDGTNWIEAGTGESAREVRDASTGFSDTTKGLTESGAVSFRLPPRRAPTVIAGQSNFWVRARLVGGDYGRDLHYEKQVGEKGAAAYAVIPPSFAAPAAGKIRTDYTMHRTSSPAAVKRYGDFSYAELDPVAPFRPFQPLAESNAFSYFGFQSEDGFPGRAISIYLGLENSRDHRRIDLPASSQATPDWEYWNGKQWTNWTVLDDTRAFRRSGVVRFLAPSDFVPKNEFGLSRFWLRVRSTVVGGYTPRLRQVALNTVMAAQGVTFSNEILGSSNGTPGQTFHTTRKPVLEREQIEVLEPAMPSLKVQRAIRADEGDGAIRPVGPVDAARGEVWMRWHEVANFNGSGPDDCHYVIDRATGAIVFGDGNSGRIPPPVAHNVVAAWYRAGGGANGNRKEHTIEQLKSAIPYIDKVTNPEAAAGGAAIEEAPLMIERARRQIRHRFRAVTAEDFEDLALLASTEVARARAAPLRNLADDPDGVQMRPGVVSLMIAPVTTDDPRPMPSMELAERVRGYLDARRVLAADLFIVGPEYISVKVEAEVGVPTPEGASEVELAVSRAISQFLHPTLGGFDGSGWQFGQIPPKSDLYSLIENVPGVDYVGALKVTMSEDRAGSAQAGYFLICSGQPKVTVFLSE